MFKKYFESISFAKLIQKDVESLGFIGSDNLMLAAFSQEFLTNDVKIFNVDKSIQDLLLNTNNQIFPRKMPYKHIFINIEIDFGTLNIKGIFVAEMAPQPEIKLSHRIRLFVFSWGIDNEDGALFFTKKSIAFEEDFNKFDDYMDDLNSFESLFYDQNIMKNVDKYSEIMPLVVCNFLDFLNNPNVKIINVLENKKRNEKRLVRKKNPVPEHNLLRISGDLKRYVGESHDLKNKSKKYSHKFWVRGHFRRYWKKERYSNLYNLFSKNKLSSDYYLDEENNVLMLWIPPHVKGKGMLISKPYELKGR